MDTQNLNDVKSEQVTQSPLTSPNPDDAQALNSESKSMIERADAVASRLENANKEAEKLAQRMEAIAARVMLSGKAEAGTKQKTPEQQQEETIDEMVKRTVSRYGFK